MRAQGSQGGVLLRQNILQVDAGNVVAERQAEVLQVSGIDEDEAKILRSAWQWRWSAGSGAG